MGVTVDLDVPGEEFVFGRLLAGIPDARAEAQTLVPTGAERLPLLWVHSSCHDTVSTHFRTHEAITGVQMCDRVDDQVLYRIAVDDDDTGITECIRDANGLLLSAAGTARTWRLSVHFQRDDELSALHETCQERGIGLQPRSVKQDCISVQPAMTLSEQQCEVLRVALEDGYFEVPRRTTLQEIAEKVGITDQAVSARLRRGMCQLLQTQAPALAGTEDSVAEQTVAPGQSQLS
jgi:predicted DNA binding protein